MIGVTENPGVYESYRHITATLSLAPVALLFQVKYVSFHWLKVPRKYFTVSLNGMLLPSS